MERRALARVKLNHQAAVEAAGQTYAVVVSDITRGGVCLHSREALPEAGTLKLVFPGISVDCPFRAVYSRSNGGDHVSGARFECDTEVIEPVLSYLASRKAQEDFAGASFDKAAKPFFGDRAPD